MNAAPAENTLQDDEARTLRRFLDHQRSAVLAIVDGLDEQAWHRPIVPSGWTPAGLLAHLGGAERHWFQDVILGLDDVLPWDDDLPDYDPHAALTCQRPPAEIMAYYRRQCARSNAVLDATALTATPLGRHSGPDETTSHRPSAGSCST